jgi:hypothetical protein
VRPTAPADLDAVAGLYAAAARARGRPSPVRREDLRIRWLMLDDPREAIVVEQPGPPQRLLAYASAPADLDPDTGEVTVHLEGQIHPEETGNGLATWILELAEAVGRRSLDRASGGGVDPSGTEVVRIRTALLDGDDDARRWFHARRFTAVRHLLELRLDLHAPPPSPRWPADIRVRIFVPDVDDEVLWRTHQAAFADVATHLPMARDDYLADRAPGDDPIGSSCSPSTSRGGAPALTTSRWSVIAVCRAGTEVAVTDGWVRDLGGTPGLAAARHRHGAAAHRLRGVPGSRADRRGARGGRRDPGGRGGALPPGRDAGDTAHRRARASRRDPA